MRYRATVCAVRGLSCLASKQPGERVSVSDLAEECGEPPRFLESTLGQMRKQGLIGADKGCAGGHYYLNSLIDVSFLTVANALNDGHAAFRPCGRGVNAELCEPCKPGRRCPLQRHVVVATQAFAESLESEKIGDHPNHDR